MTRRPFGPSAAAAALLLCVFLGAVEPVHADFDISAMLALQEPEPAQPDCGTPSCFQKGDVPGASCADRTVEELLAAGGPAGNISIVPRVCNAQPAGTWPPIEVATPVPYSNQATGCMDAVFAPLSFYYKQAGDTGFPCSCEELPDLTNNVFFDEGVAGFRALFAATGVNACLANSMNQMLSTLPGGHLTHDTGTPFSDAILCCKGRAVDSEGAGYNYTSATPFFAPPESAVQSGAVSPHIFLYASKVLETVGVMEAGNGSSYVWTAHTTGRVETMSAASGIRIVPTALVGKQTERIAMWGAFSQQSNYQHHTLLFHLQLQMPAWPGMPISPSVVVGPTGGIPALGVGVREDLCPTSGTWVTLLREGQYTRMALPVPPVDCGPQPLVSPGDSMLVSYVQAPPVVVATLEALQMAAEAPVMDNMAYAVALDEWGVDVVLRFNVTVGTDGFIMPARIITPDALYDLGAIEDESVEMAVPVLPFVSGGQLTCDGVALGELTVAFQPVLCPVEQTGHGSQDVVVALSYDSSSSSLTTKYTLEGGNLQAVSLGEVDALHVMEDEALLLLIELWSPAVLENLQLQLQPGDGSVDYWNVDEDFSDNMQRPTVVMVKEELPDRGLPLSPLHNGNFNYSDISCTDGDCPWPRTVVRRRINATLEGDSGPGSGTDHFYFFLIGIEPRQNVFGKGLISATLTAAGAFASQSPAFLKGDVEGREDDLIVSGRAEVFLQTGASVMQVSLDIDDVDNDNITCIIEQAPLTGTMVLRSSVFGDIPLAENSTALPCPSQSLPYFYKPGDEGAPYLPYGEDRVVLRVLRGSGAPSRQVAIMLPLATFCLPLAVATWTKDGAPCQACPTNARCRLCDEDGGNCLSLPVCRAGFWNVRDDVTDFASLRGDGIDCIQCNPRSACVDVQPPSEVLEALAESGGEWETDEDAEERLEPLLDAIAEQSNVEHPCSTGYTGIACGQCMSGFYRLSGRCYECNPTSLIVVVAVAVGVLLLLLPLVIWSLQQGMNLRFLLITTTYLQTLALFASFDLEWNTALESILSAMSTVNLNPALLQTDCAPTASSSVTTVQVMFYGPLALLSLLVFIFAVSAVVAFVRYGRGPLLRAALADKFFLLLRGLTTTLSFIYLQTTSTSISYLHCSSGRLHTEPSVACDSPRYLAARPYAIGSLLLYVIGTPLLILMLYLGAKRWSDPQRLGFAKGLRPGWEWWQLVTLSRKAALVMVQLLFEAYPLFQATLGVVLLFINLAVLVHYRPYSSKLFNYADTVSVACAAVVLYCGMLVHAQTIVAREQVEENLTQFAGVVLPNMAVALLILSVLVMLDSTVRSFRAELRRVRAERQKKRRRRRRKTGEARLGDADKLGKAAAGHRRSRKKKRKKEQAARAMRELARKRKTLSAETQVDEEPAVAIELVTNPLHVQAVDATAGDDAAGKAGAV